MIDASDKRRIAIVGDVALELMAPYFEEAGFSVYVPKFFGSWREELIDESSLLHKFNPEKVFDVTAFDEDLEKEVDDFRDERMKILASMPYSIDGIRAIVEECKYAMVSKECKILAVDADNTLWKGILSEDGEDSLVPFSVFQSGLKTLAAEGVALALISKNDPFQFREDMPLKTGDFASVKISWAPKSASIAEVCQKLNLPSSSVVFLDDNPMERLEVASVLKDVTVAPWEGWDGTVSKKKERQLLRRLKKYFFNSMGKTKEDRLRTLDYVASSLRAAMKCKTKQEYLEKLELRVSAREARDEDLARLSQMAAKTNQFNATTIRRNEKDFEAIIGSDYYKVFVFETRDVYAEQGIVAYVIVNVSDKTDVRITDFVMSCRVMGRTLEHYIVSYLEEIFGFRPEIDFVPTEKNLPFKEFLNSLSQNQVTYYRPFMV